MRQQCLRTVPPHKISASTVSQVKYKGRNKVKNRKRQTREGGNEIHRQEFDDGSSLPDEAWLADDNGEPMYGERDYERIPMTPFERFCDEHFGGVVGG